MQKDGENFLPHVCNERCKMRVSSKGGPEDTKCRKINSNKICKDCTKDTFMELPKNWSKDCIDQLIMLGLAEVVWECGKSPFGHFLVKRINNNYI